MKRPDSLYRSFIVFLTAFGLSNCVSTGVAVDVGTISSSLVESTKSDSEILHAFQSICLSNLTDPAQWGELAFSNEWQEADETQLAASGLQNLRKLVLSVPGGGARFEEEQILLKRARENADITLNLERKFVRDQTLSSRCEVYGKFHHLQTCEALGQGIGKPPDHNQYYQERGAHFIRWNTQVGHYPATISCETAPQNPTLSYDGISLKLQIDQVEPIRIQAAVPVSHGNNR